MLVFVSDVCPQLFALSCPRRSCVLAGRWWLRDRPSCLARCCRGRPNLGCPSHTLSPTTWIPYPKVHNEKTSNKVSINSHGNLPSGLVWQHYTSASWGSILLKFVSRSSSSHFSPRHPRSPSNRDSNTRPSPGKRCPLDQSTSDPNQTEQRPRHNMSTDSTTYSWGEVRDKYLHAKSCKYNYNNIIHGVGLTLLSIWFNYIQ